MTADRRPSAGGADGFTLVEVLVAFAIISLAIVFVIRIGGEAATRDRRIEAIDTLVDEAEGIVLLRAAAGTLRAGREHGRFSDGRPWTLSVVDVGPAFGWQNQPPLWRVRLSEGEGEGEGEGRPVYVTLFAAGLGGG